MKPNGKKVLALALLSIAVFSACDQYKREIEKQKENIIGNKQQNEKSKDSTKRIPESKQKEQPVNQGINYYHFFISNKHVLDSLKRQISNPDSAYKLRIVETLNRKSFRYIHVKDTILLPDKFVPDLKDYSIFPQNYTDADSIPKLIILSNIYQAYGAYEHGRLVRFAAVNTGKKKDPLRSGLYHLMWKDEEHRSSINHKWKMPFTFNISRHGNAFHQYNMPGYPISHGCARQFKEDAEWLYNWGDEWHRDARGRLNHDSGTPVIILDDYNYSWGKKGPWLYIKSNEDNILRLPDNPLSFKARK